MAFYVIVPERSKGSDLRSDVLKHSWVRTPPMTFLLICYNILYIYLDIAEIHIVI